MSWTLIHFRLRDTNYEKLFSVSAFQGDGMEVTINRAISLYEAIHRAEPGMVLAWDDTDGKKRELLILPASVQALGPRWLRWLRFNVTLERSGGKK